jgi:hypothetical protein
MRILGFGAVNPGGLALIHNLTRSFAFSERLDQQMTSDDKSFDAYLTGIDNEIYRVNLTAKHSGWAGMSYREAVRSIYSEFGSLLIGIEKRADTGGPKEVCLDLCPPPDYVIGSTGEMESGYVITKSKQTCDEIEAWHPDMKPRGPRRNSVNAKVSPDEEKTQLVPSDILRDELATIASQLMEVPASNASLEVPLSARAEGAMAPAAYGNAGGLARRNSVLLDDQLQANPQNLPPLNVSHNVALNVARVSGVMPDFRGHVLICGPLTGISLYMKQ